jgi:acetyl esterase/lipase
MFAGLLFTYGLVSVFVSVNAIRRPTLQTRAFPPLWLPAMIVGELPVAVLIIRLVVTGFLVAVGGLRHPLGWLGLFGVILAQALLIPQFARTSRALEAIGPEPDPPRGLAETMLGRPALPPQVEVVEHIPYHEDLTLDLYRVPGADDGRPALLFLHGGSWSAGDPHRQARPMMHRLAEEGWLVATIRYPLSPAATFPDHLVGVKRAIAWARNEGWRLGIDPDRIAIAGGSAGAHLAALAALTANRPELQPGFEHVDTGLSACVGLYGVYDFLNRNRTRWDWPVIPLRVMKSTAASNPEGYRLASPLDQVGDHAPPFLVIHGSHDSLVPPAEARAFVEALERVSQAPVVYHEVTGAQHAFDAVSSPRSRAVAALIAGFLKKVT